MAIGRGWCFKTTVTQPVKEGGTVTRASFREYVTVQRMRLSSLALR